MDDEIRATLLRFARKLSGFNKPLKATEVALGGVGAGRFCA